MATATTPTTTTTKGAPTVHGSRVLGGGKWLQISELSFTNERGEEAKWEVAERATRTKNDSADGVFCIPCVRPRSQPFIDGRLILVSQFRPPVGKNTLEFPAGLVDEGEDAAAAAVRELKEETGYVGEVTSVGPSSCLDPGMSNASVQYVHMLVDTALAANKKGAQKQQAAEDVGLVKVHLLPVRGLKGAIDDLVAREGFMVNTSLATFVEAVAMTTDNAPTKGHCAIA